MRKQKRSKALNCQDDCNIEEKDVDGCAIPSDSQMHSKEHLGKEERSSCVLSSKNNVVGEQEEQSNLVDDSQLEQSSDDSANSYLVVIFIQNFFIIPTLLDVRHSLYNPKWLIY